jgi:hypothetical protein
VRYEPIQSLVLPAGRDYCRGRDGTNDKTNGEIMRIKSCIIYDHGDPAKGIQGEQWELSFGDGITIKDDEIEKLRAEVNHLALWRNRPTVVEFDFEKRLDGERAESDEMDQLSDIADEVRAEKHNWARDPDFCGCAECERINKLVDSIFQE